MSYTIDIYSRNIKAEKDFLRYATFIAFFPQLVAGPIVRASEFLPQLKSDRPITLDNIYLGMTQVAWGFFKKICIADSLGPFVDNAFSNPGPLTSIHLIIAVVFYSFQIYCDFSGYSAIAIGLARIMGFEFPRNFNMPYFSKSFSEFWTRWHVTLSGWLKDYLYIPLGGNKKGTYRTYLNLMITMVLGGLWHGASWNFVLWGFIHGLFLIIQRIVPAVNTTNKVLEYSKVILVYTCICFTWIFFRSVDFNTTQTIIGNIFSLNGFDFFAIPNLFILFKDSLLITLLIIAELFHAKSNIYNLLEDKPMLRIASITTLILIISLLGTFDVKSFIYFQF